MSSVTIINNTSFHEIPFELRMETILNVNNLTEI